MSWVRFPLLPYTTYSQVSRILKRCYPTAKLPSSSLHPYSPQFSLDKHLLNKKYQITLINVWLRERETGRERDRERESDFISCIRVVKVSKACSIHLQLLNHCMLDVQLLNHYNMDIEVMTELPQCFQISLNQIKVILTDHISLENINK